MKTTLIGLIGVVAFLIGSTASADALGVGDDTYIGFQVTIPIGGNRAGFLSGGNEYSAMLMKQSDGMRDGIVFTRDSGGMQTLGYLRPSRTYRIGHSRISDYTIPVARLGEGSGVQSGFAGGELVFGVVAGIVLLAKLTEYLHDETTDCLDPETESEEIAGC